MGLAVSSEGLEDNPSTIRAACQPPQRSRVSRDYL